MVMPALPKEASLAREQVELVIGHLQITLAQYDQTPGFERQEAEDFRDLAATVVSLAKGGSSTTATVDALQKALDASIDLAALEQTAVIQKALDDVLIALEADGTCEAQSAVRTRVLEVAAHRADVDRRWFSLMGFDPEIVEKMSAQAATAS
ncbi:hypothetical protein JI59_17635 [Novosphingobium pentaromativorans US6-1]|uniref:Uncharacterized protein n=1 Tax=Novosphingobium pentaromativorans US6-1 TaxID=1088721 RepID=G6E821_9SPHN|nr:hypothetical protein JI59_17635 [Novosphingobium pentaromativorans US6-1]EHJ62664.1 hypothetical protein NSU_0492 [Novosphingobium pentaromativorans US6-1]